MNTCNSIFAFMPVCEWHIDFEGESNAWWVLLKDTNEFMLEFHVNMYRKINTILVLQFSEIKIPIIRKRLLDVLIYSFKV
jgi:hypothetical protein